MYLYTNMHSTTKIMDNNVVSDNFKGYLTSQLSSTLYDVSDEYINNVFIKIRNM